MMIHKAISPLLSSRALRDSGGRDEFTNGFRLINGYEVMNLFGDIIIHATDFAIADNNEANIVSVIRP